METIQTRRGPLDIPAFLPDATRAAVRTLDSQDVEKCNIQCLMVNAIHISNHPGTLVIKAHGGIHEFMRWNKPIFSDSGGFQVYSLIAENAKLGSVTPKGFTYRLEKSGPKNILTPEKSIQKQFQLGADVMFCLDYCTHPDADESTQKESVKLTIQWAQRCKEEFDRQLQSRKSKEKPPLLFAVIQGGNHKDLRRQCTENLFEIGFDGYGFGGWPVDGSGELVEALEWVAQWVAPHFPLHGLGIGKPENVVKTFDMGFHTFDCVLPTRDARHRRMYVFKGEPGKSELREPGFYEYYYMQDKKYVRDTRPVDESCDCPCCKNYSRAYLYHLLKVEEPTVYRLATMHNLRFYSRLMEILKTEN